jgi:hypothetical protein
MRLDREKLKQAVMEFWHAALVAWVPLFIAFLAGFSENIDNDSHNEVIIPNFSLVRAFVVSSVSAAALAGAKAGWWYLTGTKSPPK